MKIPVPIYNDDIPEGFDYMLKHRGEWSQELIDLLLDCSESHNFCSDCQFEIECNALYDRNLNVWTNRELKKGKHD